MSPRVPKQQGFALITIAALFIAFALIATVMMDRTNATQQITQQASTKAQMQRLSNALTQYALYHQGLLPCPARPDVDFSNAGFGVQATPCSTATPPAGLFLYPNNVVIRGMVPVMDLAPYGIDVNDAFDAWNDRIMYVVDKQLTLNGSGVPGNKIYLVDTYNSSAFKKPDYVLISYGRDALGAIPKSSTTVQIPCPTTTGTWRVQNCQSPTSTGVAQFWTTPQATSPNTNAGQYFDDILAFGSVKVAGCASLAIPVSSCSYPFPALPNGATSDWVKNTMVSVYGAARAKCTGGALVIQPGATCASSCTPDPSKYTTTVGLNPSAFCPGSAPDTVDFGNYGAQIYPVIQNVTYTSGWWHWNVWTYNTTTGACTGPVDTYSNTSPPKPYTDSCGNVTLGP